MFDIGFAELLLIGVVGLIVLGPERLPVAVRTVSLWVGKLRRSFNSIRTEIERELNTEEIKKELHNNAIMQGLEETKAQLQGTVETPYDIGEIGKPHTAEKPDSEGKNPPDS